MDTQIDIKHVTSCVLLLAVYVRSIDGIKLGVGGVQGVLYG